MKHKHTLFYVGTYYNSGGYYWRFGCSRCFQSKDYDKAKYVASMLGKDISDGDQT